MIDRLAELEARYGELSAELSAPQVAHDSNRMADVGREMARLEPIVSAARELAALREQLVATHAMDADPEEEVRVMAREEAERLAARQAEILSELRDMLVPQDPRDERNVILEVRAGAGGDEASLFAGDLYRMYARYAERRRWKVEVLSTSENDSGGFKEIIAELRGDGAFSRMKFESGVHRVQRVPVTEASGRIHTSTATVSVLPEAEEVEVQIDEKDLRVDVYRSSGPGGQSVNTTDSAVRITHLPTGLVVAIQDEKSQHKNRAKAMSVLRARLYEAQQERLAAERGEERRSQVGSGERSEKIRTYNQPDDRVTDHRIGVTVHNLPGLLEGDLDRLIDPLVDAEQTRRLGSLDLDDDGDPA